MTSHTGSAWRILGDFEKVRNWDLPPGRRLVFACSRRPLWRVPHVLGRGRWKSQNRKIVPLTPYVEEPLNSKVIKSFVPKQRSRYVFFEFQDSCSVLYIYMNIICPFRIFMYMAMVHIIFFTKLSLKNTLYLPTNSTSDLTPLHWETLLTIHNFCRSKNAISNLK